MEGADATFGRYRLIELLGRGGMGEVWRAHDETIDRAVALKLLLPHYATDPEFNERFRREARAAARLDDPHVVPIYDVGEHEGRLFVTMRLIAGRDLQSVLKDGALSSDRAVAVCEQIAGALHTAHGTGLVHRDVKPSNILLADHDFAYLIDFGLARGAGESALTSTSMTVGTWAYMAPERFTSRDIAPSSDVYALACVLYQCLTGQVPYPGETLEQVVAGHVHGQVPKPSLHQGVPEALDDVIAAGLAKKPEDRPAVLELAAAARRALGERDAVPISAPDASRTQASTYYVDERPTTPAHVGAFPPAAPTALAQPSQKGRSRPPYVLIGALVAVVLLVAAGLLAAVRLTSHDDSVAAPSSASSSAAAPSPPGPQPNTGPFTGVYRADFGRATGLDGAPTPGTQPSTGTYGVRSVCAGETCAATAAKFAGEGAFAEALVFDEVGDVWLAVTVAPGQCKGVAAETWQTFRLRPRPDGTLSGEHTRTTANQCAEKRTVTLTRTGDVDVDADFFALPDPTELPPRVVSPAEALRGRYHVNRTFTRPGLPVMEADSSVVTDCLRTGDRCMSYFVIASGDLPLVFDGTAWVDSNQTEGPCPGGDLATLKADARFPLPAPPQNPIQRLSGHGTWVQTGSCAIEFEYDETFTRTGD